MVNGRLRLCQIFMSPAELGIGIPRGCRVSLSATTKLTMYNSAPIRRRVGEAYLLSKEPTKIVKIIGTKRNLQDSSKLIRVYDQADSANENEEQISLSSIIKDMYQMPVSIRVADLKNGKPYHVFIDNIVPLCNQLLRVGRHNIRRTSRIAAVRYPASTLILEALGIPIKARHDWKMRINTKLVTAKHTEDEPGQTRLHFEVRDISPEAWNHVMRDLIHHVPGLTLDTLKEIPMHPNEEILRLTYQEIDKCALDEAIYLLARIVKLSESVNINALSFSNLAAEALNF